MNSKVEPAAVRLPRDYGAASTRKSKILHQPSTINLHPCTLYRAICAWILLSFAVNLKPDASHFSMHLQPCTLHPVFILYRLYPPASNLQHECLVPLAFQLPALNFELARIVHSRNTSILSPKRFYPYLVGSYT